MYRWATRLTEKDARLRKGCGEARIGVARLLQLLGDGARQHERQSFVGVALLVAGPQDGRQLMKLRDFLEEKVWARFAFEREHMLGRASHLVKL